VRCSFWHENGHDVVVAEPSKAVAVPQHLAETEPELLFFILVRDAFDFGDEDGAVSLPGQVEVRLVREPGTRLDPRLAKDVRERILGVGMALEPAFDKGRINREWLPLARQGADFSFPVLRAKRRGRSGWGLRGRRCLPGGRGERREELDELRWQLIQVGLLRPRFGAAVEAEREVETSGMAGSQRVKDSADAWRPLTDVSKGYRPIQRERAVQVEPPARLRACLLKAAPGCATVGEPDRRRFGDMACGSRPGSYRMLVLVVVEDHVAGLDPPDQ
jgi:hypothetical protein